MRIAIPLMLIVAMLAGGCAATTAEQVEEQTIASEESLANRSLLRSQPGDVRPSTPEYWLIGPELSGGGTCLRAHVKDGHAADFSLFYFHTSLTWFYPESATDSAGNTLKYVDLYPNNKRRFLFLMVLEAGSIELIRDILVGARSGTGLVITVQGKSRTDTVTVPAFYVAGFLRKVDSRTQSAP